VPTPGRRGAPGSDPDGGRDPAARLRLNAIGTACLAFAHEEPGLFATAFALPQRHAYGTADRMPLDQLRAWLDELADAGVLDRRRHGGLEYPIWAAVHGMAVLAGEGPLRDVPEATRRKLEELTLTFIGDSLA
jgi:Tetracyclin repressor-like, C-terminal domain